MAIYRKVPARIITRDYVGVTTSESSRYRKMAEGELTKLEQQVLRGDLDQGTRRFSLGDNVFVEATVCYNLKQAVVVIGADAHSKAVEKQCYCCSPGLAAGLITHIEHPDPTGDDHYFADIILCQAPVSGGPKRITVYDEFTSGGVSRMQERVVLSEGYYGVPQISVPYSDHQRHTVGEEVLVLIQPLFSVTPLYGEYSPAVNRRWIADEVVEFPALPITPLWTNSSGDSCRIMQDEAVWKHDPDVPPPADPDEYNEILERWPFRILPIRIDSCL